MSSTDPLEKWRKPIKTPDAVIAATEAYNAFQVAKSPHHLWLRRKAAEADWAPNYNNITTLITDGRTMIGVGFTNMTVEIFGRNLGELFRALLDHQVDWIQSFDPKKWPTEPTGESAMVTDIQVHFSTATLPPPPEQRH